MKGDHFQRVLLSGRVAPPGVPGGLTGSPMLASKSGESISVTWDSTTCAGSAHYTLLYGKGTGLPSSYGGTYQVAGARCNIGPSPYTWSDSPDPTDNPSRLYWWLIVAHDGAGTEGSWGSNSGAVERTGPGTNGSSGSCYSIDKSTANTCGINLTAAP